MSPSLCLHLAPPILGGMLFQNCCVKCFRGLVQFPHPTPPHATTAQLFPETSGKREKEKQVNDYCNTKSDQKPLSPSPTRALSLSLSLSPSTPSLSLLSLSPYFPFSLSPPTPSFSLPLSLSSYSPSSFSLPLLPLSLSSYSLSLSLFVFWTFGPIFITLTEQRKTHQSVWTIFQCVSTTKCGSND